MILLKSIFLTPPPVGYGHRGICRETWLNKFRAFVLGAVPCPSQLLSAPSAAFAFCAAFHWWCQGWLHLLSLCFCDVPYAWNIFLALIQETTFSYHPLWNSFPAQHPLDELIQGKKTAEYWPWLSPGTMDLIQGIFFLKFSFFKFYFCCLIFQAFYVFK